MLADSGERLGVLSKVPWPAVAGAHREAEEELRAEGGDADGERVLLDTES